MKRAWRWLRWVLLAVFAPVLVLVVLLAVAMSGLPPIPERTSLEGFVQFVKDGYVAAFVVDLGDGTVALVDTGNDREGKAILAELSARGLGPDAVSAILLTHGHPDHVAGCHLFKKARVFSSIPEKDVVEGRVRSGGLITRLAPHSDSGCHVTDTLEDGAKVMLGTRTFQAFVVPGHTRGSTAWLVGGVLFLGDSADATKERTLVGAKWLFTEDTAQNAEALSKLAAQLSTRRNDVRFLAFSHTGMLPGLEPLEAFAKSRTAAK